MTANSIAPEVSLALIQNRAERLAADMRTIHRLDPLLISAVEGIAADLTAVIDQTVSAPQINAAEVRHIVAGRFAAVHRSRRSDGRHRPDTLLSIWVAWEKTRDEFGRDVAEAEVNGWTASLPERCAAYAVARERMNTARRRYFDAYRAAKAAAAVTQ